MRNNSYAPHYAIGRYSIREFKTGAEPFMLAIIIIIIIIMWQVLSDLADDPIPDPLSFPLRRLLKSTCFKALLIDR